MCNNKNNKPQASDKTGVIGSLVTPSNSFNEFEHTESVPDFVSDNHLEQLKNQSSQFYLQSHVQKYKAIGYAYVWYHAAKGNQAYLEKAFQGMTEKSSNWCYVNTIKFCLNLTSDQQASSITKYAKVMKYIESKLGSDVDASTADQFVENIVAEIEECGGLGKAGSGFELYKPRNENSNSKVVDASLEKPNNVDDDAADEEQDIGEPSPTENIVESAGGINVPISNTTKRTGPKITREYVDSKIRQYVDGESLASFTYKEVVEVEGSGLVVMVGMARGNCIDVVRVLANDDILEALIKAEVKLGSEQGES